MFTDRKYSEKNYWSLNKWKCGVIAKDLTFMISEPKKRKKRAWSKCSQRNKDGNSLTLANDIKI